MEQIEYSRTVVPSSMRSLYWKYFGFPSDNGNNILTRQKIVCTLCNCAIAYNKNTSNLRTHLMAKHTETFQKLLSINNGAEEQPGESSEGDYKSKVKRNRPNLFEMDISARSEQIMPPSNVLASTTIGKSDNNQHSEQSTSASANGDHVLEMADSSHINSSFNYLEPLPSINIRGDKPIPISGHQQQRTQQPVEYLLADLLQMDLLSLDTIKGQGFSLYNRQLSGSPLEDETLGRVKSILRQRIADTRQLINDYVHQLTRISPYSLSMECSSNCDDDVTILNIYLNFLNESQNQLKSVLYNTTMIGSNINLSAMLKNLNLKNCISILISDLRNVEGFILEFAESCEMELVECLACSLTRSVQRIFKLPSVARHFQELVNNHALKTRCFSWSKLKHFENMYGMSDEGGAANNSEMKLIFDYIKPLKTALNIVSDDQLSLCTLNRPLIMKLFEQHFDNVKDNHILIDIRNIFDEELWGSMNRSVFLSEATYFDARFRQNFIANQDSLFDVNTLRRKVMERFKHLVDVNYADISNVSCVDTNTRKSDLKTFLNRTEPSATSHVIDAKSNLYLEFERYHIEAELDVDQNPVVWWREHAQIFQELHKIALHYLTTPCCCVQRLHSLDLDDQWLKLNRRKQLNPYCDIESNLWYLHYNDCYTHGSKQVV